MKSLHQNILFAVVAFSLLLTACNDNETAAEADGRPQVVTTVSPLANIIYNISGDHIALSSIVPEGVNSHTFEPAPSDAVKLTTADLIFINGLNLELPTLRLAEANLKEGGEIIILGEQTISPAEYVYDFSFPPEAGNPNPHLWTNPIYALRYAEIVRDKLIERDPDNADSYRQNFNTFAGKIGALDEAIKATAASIPAQNRKLLTYHDSFAYFAPRYGFSVIGAVQPADFSEPSAQEVAGLIEQLRAEEVPAIFGSEVFSSPVLDQIGREAGVSYVATLRDDDLPGEPGAADHSYIGLMVYDLKIMASALGGDPTLMDGVDSGNVTGVDTAVDQSQ
ncbi:MAG: zinc ABC transporter substrate-binding protein [Chloroflexi bacterium]|nr:zinc ABC transporter substrate-binding protein [Chloroflexota bacterium]